MALRRPRRPIDYVYIAGGIACIIGAVFMFCRMDWEEFSREMANLPRGHTGISGELIHGTIR